MTRAARIYRDWHWGIPHGVRIPIRDKDYPVDLIECGRMVGFDFKPDPRSSVVKELRTGEDYEDRSHTAFDPDHRWGRLYTVTPREVREDALTAFWKPRGQVWDLGAMAKVVGGRHGRMTDWAPVEVQPIGQIYKGLYYAKKEGDVQPDGKGCIYVHKFGEEGGIPPWLAVDAKGRLWIVGGDYRGNPTPGITD